MFLEDTRYIRMRNSLQVHWSSILLDKAYTQMIPMSSTFQLDTQSILTCLTALHRSLLDNFDKLFLER
jgi:hypothetical protein